MITSLLHPGFEKRMTSSISRPVPFFETPVLWLALFGSKSKHVQNLFVYILVWQVCFCVGLLVENTRKTTGKHRFSHSSCLLLSGCDFCSCSPWLPWVLDLSRVMGNRGVSFFFFPPWVGRLWSDFLRFFVVAAL